MSAGCAPSGLALHLREHQWCRRCTEVFGDEDPGVQDRRLPREVAGRVSICSSMSGDIGVDAVDPAERVREQELAMAGEMPVERSAQLISLLLYLPPAHCHASAVGGR